MTTDRASEHPAEHSDEPDRRDDASEADIGRWRRKQPAEKPKGSMLKELPILLVVAFVLALLIKAFLVQAFFIPSGSMEPTLHGCPGCPGDRVLVNKVPYYFDDPEPGDIVVFRGPESWVPEFQVTEPSNVVQSLLLGLGRAIGTAPPDEKDFVKRVVATGGQTVECCDTDGRVTVDGQPLTEPYLASDSPIETRSFGPITVPGGGCGSWATTAPVLRTHGPMWTMATWERSRSTT
ncbi:MAG: signal peptidase I [Geodermatophilaceae bacterium]